MKSWMECVYEYDGTYHGLLCCVFDSYTRKETPVSIVLADTEQISLYPVHVVQTEDAHVRRILRSIYAKSARAAELIKKAHLTCLAEKELLIYRLICRLYEEGPAFLNCPTDPLIFPLYTAVRHMNGELEKLRGFVRFSEFEGFYAAEIEPKNRVLPALRGHFCNRFADQAFMIYDRTHQEALFYAKGRWKIVPMEHFEMAVPGEEEALYRRLWKTFFDTVSIKERTNPRCQRTHMPLRYRSTMTEFQDEAYFRAAEKELSQHGGVPSLPGAH